MSKTILQYRVPEEQIVTHYYLPHEKFKKIPTFHWYESPVFGVGKRSIPMLAVDEYLTDQTRDLLSEANDELTSNRKTLEPYIKGLVVNGIVPRRLNHGVDSIDAFLLRDFGKPHTWKGQDAEWIQHYDQLSQVKSYFYKKYTIVEPWTGVVHLREFTTFARKAEPSAWLPRAESFPTIKRLIESLPFKQLGYALCFIGKPDIQVPIHRDTYARDHHFSNFINIQIDGKPKPTFTFDSLRQKKYYLQPYSSFYTFNESDLHGVEPDEQERWMIRVEGKFEDWFADAIGLENHEVFNWSYSSAQGFLKEHPTGIYVNPEWWRV